MQNEHLNTSPRLIALGYYKLCYWFKKNDKNVKSALCSNISVHHEVVLCAMWCSLLFNFWLQDYRQRSDVLYFLESCYVIQLLPIISNNFGTLNYVNNNLLQRMTNTSELFSKLIALGYSFVTSRLRTKMQSLHCSQMTAPRGNLLYSVCFFLPLLAVTATAQAFWAQKRHKTTARRCLHCIP